MLRIRSSWKSLQWPTAFRCASTYFFSRHDRCSEMTHIPVMPAKPHPQGVCPGRSDAGLLGRPWTTTGLAAGEPVVGTSAAFASRLRPRGQAVRTPGAVGVPSWNPNACSWYFINWFNLMNLSTSLGYAVGVWESLKVADAKIGQKWLTVEYGGTELCVRYYEQALWPPKEVSFIPQNFCSYFISITLIKCVCMCLLRRLVWIIF